jgi:hypothetical protein
MDDKKVFIGVYEMSSYTDVLRHIVDEHGEEGLAIVQDSSEMPVLWHEFDHSEKELDHVHLNDHKKSVERVGGILEEFLSDESIVKKLIEKAESDGSTEEREKYLEELKGEK